MRLYCNPINIKEILVDNITIKCLVMNKPGMWKETQNPKDCIYNSDNNQIIINNKTYESNFSYELMKAL